MSLEQILDRHNDHQVVIIFRLHKHKLNPIPGLYCHDCCKLIKWLSLDQAEELLAAGVDDLGMLPDEENLWQRRLKIAQLK
jgi:hypothetical protein